MKRFYLIIICQIIALLLFVGTHVTYVLFLFFDKIYIFGILVRNFLFALFFISTIIIQIVSILLLISLEVSNN